jgi:hypothetical protein
LKTGGQVRFPTARKHRGACEPLTTDELKLMKALVRWFSTKTCFGLREVDVLALFLRQGERVP